jgi:cation diffusion facilitator family transporter
MAGESTSHILQSLTVNALIATAKGVAAFYTGSGAMLAETIHSFADCGNQLLLLLGVKQARRVPDPSHPLGYGRALYFWSFIVALLLFSGGGLYSIYEGFHKLAHPEPVERVWLGVAILGFSLLLEGWSTVGNVLELRKRAAGRPFLRFLRETKDSDLVVIFGENSAAVLGLTLALASLGIASATGDGRWDAAGSLAIGAVLVAVAIFLAKEVKSLIIGESADHDVEQAARAVLVESSGITEILRIITVQQGPGEVMVAMKVRCKDGLSGAELIDAINDYETRLHAKCPEVRWSFVEPDIAD